MPINSISKTGLIASPKKSIFKFPKPDAAPPNLSKCAIARPVQFSLRPFGGLYNPYAKGCSILCNHPGPNEVKTVVRRAKDTWLHETNRAAAYDGRHSCHDGGAGAIGITAATPVTAVAYHANGGCDSGAGGRIDLPEHVPEEFFRRYTGSDSRPMTPTPTVASGRTRTSTGSHAHGAGGAAATAAATRRCFTPDPGVHGGAQMRQHLVLDLRRSHSQETLYWNASSELTPKTKGEAVVSAAAAAAAAATAAPGRSRSGPGGGAMSSMSTTRPKPSTSPATANKSAREMRLCEQEAKKRADERAAQLQREEEARGPPPAVCINALDEYDDGEDDGPRRRGKRKKKSNKPAAAGTYKVSQEPETQIATLGPDSPNQSQRASLVPNGANAPYATEQLMAAAAAAGAGGDGVGGRRFRESSFISEEAMQYLRRGLTVDVLEGAFDRYLNRALAEAIRTVPPDQLDRASDALLAYQAAHPLAPADPIRWLGMPRKYTRKSVRFTLPINTYDLRTITPFEYVSRHVWLSDYRKELCRCVFVKYQPPASSASAVTGEGGNETTTNSATGNATTTNTNSSDNNAGPVGNRNNDDGAAAAAMAADENASTAAPVLVERTLDCTADLDAALGEVLGFYGTPERIVEIRAMLCLDVEHQQPQTQLPQKEQAQMVARMNFRSWCGVVAFGERFLNRLSRTQDPCDEIEVADFSSLERKLNNVAVNEPMRRLLTWLKYN